MKEGWEYKKLGEVCSITMGQSPASSSINESDGIEFHQGKTCFGKRFLGVSPSLCNAPVKLAEAHTVLLCVRAPVGFPNITERKICIGRGLCALSGNGTLDNNYLFYSLIGKQSYFEKNSTGSTFKAISSKVVANTVLPLPPLSQQQSIVAELDKINEIIDLKKEQLKDLDLLAQSIFYDMFGDPIENSKGWEVKKLGEVSKVKIGPFGSLLHKSDYVTGGTPLVNPIHMKDGHIVKDDNFTITDEKKNEMSAYLLKEGDVLFARRGEIGRSAIVTKHEDGYLCGTGSLFVRFQEKLNNVFVLYWTNSKSFITELVAQSKGATMLNINCKIVEDLNIILPPLSLQQSFSSKIQAIESQKSTIKQSLAEVETLLASRMDYWFGQ